MSDEKRLKIFQGDVELMSGDPTSIRVIFYNLTGRNEQSDHAEYLRYMAGELEMERLEPAEMRIEGDHAHEPRGRCAGAEVRRDPVEGLGEVVWCATCRSGWVQAPAPQTMRSLRDVFAHFGVQTRAGLTDAVRERLGSETAAVQFFGGIGQEKGFNVGARDTAGDWVENTFNFPLEADQLSVGMTELQLQVNPDQAEREGEEFTFTMYQGRDVVTCPKCGKEIWDKATVDQRLNKCWGCGHRWLNDTVEEEVEVGG